MFLSCYVEGMRQVTKIANTIEAHDAGLIVESVQVVRRTGAFPYEVLFRVVPGRASYATNGRIHTTFNEIVKEVIGD